MCKIPFITVENMAEMCAVLQVTPEPRYCQYTADDHMEGELQTGTHDSVLFPGVVLTAGVFSPPHFMSFYAVHQVLTFRISVEKPLVHHSSRKLPSGIQ